MYIYLSIYIYSYEQAHLHEHEGAVNCLAVSNDSIFFVSGSDDGSVKIWDCQRLEKNIANRSRLTYSSQGIT
jgi:phosphoinositide-3-kinase regulatory subunit 4